jgi:tetratricopeptide (TPR) repeat protein
MFLLLLLLRAAEPAAAGSAPSQQPRTRCLATLCDAYDAMVVQNFPVAKECFLACVQSAPYCPVVLRFLEWLKKKKHLADAELTPELQFILKKSEWIPEEETLAEKYVKAMQYYWTATTSTKKKDQNAATANLKGLAEQKRPRMPFARVLYGLAINDPQWIVMAMERQESWAFHRYKDTPIQDTALEKARQFLDENKKKEGPIGELEYEYFLLTQDENWGNKGIQLCFAPVQAASKHPVSKVMSKEWPFMRALSGDAKSQYHIMLMLEKEKDKEGVLFFADLLLKNSKATAQQKAWGCHLLGRQAEKCESFEEMGGYFFTAYNLYTMDVVHVVNLMDAIAKGFYRPEPGQLEGLLAKFLVIMKEKTGKKEEETYRNDFYCNLLNFYCSHGQTGKNVEVLKQWGTPEAYRKLFYMAAKGEHSFSDQEVDGFYEKLENPTNMEKIHYACHVWQQNIQKAFLAIKDIKIKGLPSYAKNMFHIIMAQHACAENKCESAQPYLKAIENLAPENFTAVGILWEELGEIEQAEMWYRAALETDSRNPIFLYNMGNILLKQYLSDPWERSRKKDQAIQFFKEAADLGDKDAFLAYHSCTTRDKTQEDIVRLLQELENRENTEFLRGQLYFELSRKEEALDCFIKAMRAGQSTAFTVCGLHIKKRPLQLEMFKTAEELGCVVAVKILKLIAGRPQGYLSPEGLSPWFKIFTSSKTQPDVLTASQELKHTEEMDVREILNELVAHGGRVKTGKGSHTTVQAGQLSCTLVRPHGAGKRPALNQQARRDMAKLLAEAREAGGGFVARNFGM